MKDRNFNFYLKNFILIFYLQISSLLTYLCMFSRFSCVRLCATPRTIAHQPPLSMGFPKKEFWCVFPWPPPEVLSNPRIDPTSLEWLLPLQVHSKPLSHCESPLKVYFISFLTRNFCPILITFAKRSYTLEFKCDIPSLTWEIHI